ncbi:DUF5625 family protein [Photorhabdus aegyptia]|uniref:DUF5625 domain-containing protein n=1 Tax=Photorhabdus aegyptia TaxID=2805098 RepID=A0A022PD21_9GAMM|nr:DUF5625 family protein [Photorhabdus aegyptia]EYU14047.1 hypothetical protein BA1DRAFT_03447 [Photorhabdus aegyptia]
MKILQVHERFKNWRNIIIFLSCILLVACSEPINIYRPIDVSHSDQSVKIDFEISKKGDYQFALLFATGRGFGEMQRRDKLFGSIDKGGVAIPVSLRVIKDGKVFFDEEINAVGYGWGRTVYYKERSINTAVRDIEILELPPGRYSAVITTLEDVPAFNDIESFVELTYFKPKI